MTSVNEILPDHSKDSLEPDHEIMLDLFGSEWSSQITSKKDPSIPLWKWGVLFLIISILLSGVLDYGIQIIPFIGQHIIITKIILMVGSVWVLWNLV